MTTSHVLVTALPFTRATDAPWHLTAFVTHKLDPGASAGTLADFPAALDWVGTLAGGSFVLVAPHLPGPVPLEVVPGADAPSWHAVFGPQVPVAVFPTPSLSGAPWRSFPAHRVGDGAVDLHLATLTAAPTVRPAVASSPVMGGLLRRLEPFRAVGTLLEIAESRTHRADDLLARRTLEAQATLGLLGARQRYPSKDLSSTSPIEALLDDTEGDARVTAWLDSLLGTDLSGDPELRLLVDAHAARRFYQRPEAQTPYAERPTPGATTPRPEPPVPDFHARVAGFGSTPTLLRRLGLAVDLRIPDAAVLAGLDGAAWVAVRFVPPQGAEVTLLAPPRTRVIVRGDAFAARSSDQWVGGAVPLGEDSYVVLDVDPDAAGLKLEQHLRDLPRTLAAEINGDPATSAPGTLRSTGFAIARTDRVEASRARIAAAEQVSAPLDGPGVAGPELGYDDVVRGVRLEVWDDVTRAWHSLHERRVDVVADPGDGTGPVPVLTDVPDIGFLQQSGLNRVPGDPSHPYHLHEVVAGWDGWSLSAPRPGKVVVHEDGVERVLDAPPDEPATGVQVRTRVEPGSLPPLRYGRSYSFRMVGVDLAGNSVPRRAAGRGRAGPSPEAVELAAAHLDRLRRVYAARDGGLLAAVRAPVLDALPVAGALPDWRGPVERLTSHGPAPVELSPRTAAERIEALVPELVRTGATEVDAAVADRLAAVVEERARSGAGIAAGRGRTATPTGAARVVGGRDVRDAVRQTAEASRVLAAAASSWRVRPQLAVDPAVLAGIAAVDDLVLAPGGSPGGLLPGRAVVTTPRPYLRWDPVPPPTLVARAPLATGEQLSRLVVRTGLPAGAPDAVEATERHVVPAKTTQVEAETAGRFDAAIGSPDPAVQRAAYGWALRERGTLLDRWIPDLDEPGGLVEQPGIALHQRPGADPATLVTLDAITAVRDTPLGEGQYVVHDVDQLTVPYLPDPYAAGVALVFYDAGAPHLLPEPRVLQAVVLPFPGDWPRVRPLRLVVEATAAGTELAARLEGTTVRIGVPAGEQVRVAMSSSLRREDLDHFGLWRSHLASTIDPDGDGSASEAEVVAAAALLRAAVSGWTWWLTPSVDLRLVHAVPAPVRPPQLAALRCLLRPPGLTVAQLAGLVDLHGASTERVVVRGAWTEQVDDVATPAPTTVAREDVVVSSPVGGDERFGLLTFVDFLPFGPSAAMVALAEGGLGLHKAVHTFADTHHRRVTYTPSGVTRYSEFFAAQDLPAPQDPALAGDPVVLDIPSSARPAAPVLVDAVPLLRWEEATEPDQPFALRRVRRSGVRLWLDRPWFSSGDDELLGVVLSTTGAEPDSSISLWGRDPTVLGAATGQATRPPLLGLGHLLLQVVGGAMPTLPARPVRPAATVALVDLPQEPAATVLPYAPEFHPATGRWHVDVAIDDGPALWPFVRLAVARYQERSISGCALSPIGLTSWVQPLPTRTATVSRPDADHVRVTLTGAVAFLRVRARHEDAVDEDLDADTPTGGGAAFDRLLRLTRAVHATVQVLPDGASDLEWRTVARRRLPAVGVGDETTFTVTWTGELALPPAGARDVPLALATPGGQERWRVLVEERELLDADPVDEPNISGTPTRAPRVVYADAIML